MSRRIPLRSEAETLQKDKNFPWFLLGIAAVVVSAVMLVAFAASAATGSNAGGGGSPLVRAGDDNVPGHAGGGDDPAPATEGATPASQDPATAKTTAPPPSATATASATASASASAAPAASSTPDNTRIVACGDILAPLNKQNRLSQDCAPGDLQQLPAGQSYGQQFLKSAAATAFLEMADEAQKAGFGLVAVSAYRSYQTQVVTYQSNVESGGQDYADRTSAKPGHSEHQLGTTVDVSTAEANYDLEGFSGSAAAAWLAANSWKFGFIVSYPAGKEGVTGYAHEPWHIRWVGKDVASRVNASGLTLTEFLRR